MKCTDLRKAVTNDQSEIESWVNYYQLERICDVLQ
jgi:hypothetical protein